MRAFVVLGLVFSTPSQESGLGKCHRNDPFCIEWDVKPQLNQSIVAHVLYWRTASMVSADPRGPRPLFVRLLHVGWNCRLEERCLPVSAMSSLCWSAVAAGKQEFLSQQVTDMGRFCLVLSVSILSIVHRRALVHTVHLVSGSTLTAAGRSQLLARWPGTHSRILSADPTSSTDCFRHLLKTYLFVHYSCIQRIRGSQQLCAIQIHALTHSQWRAIVDQQEFPSQQVRVISLVSQHTQRCSQEGSSDAACGCH